MEEKVIFIQTEPDSYGPNAMIGGIRLIERIIREEAKKGVKKAIVVGEKFELPEGFPVEVEWVSDGTKPPEGIPIIRGDTIRGVVVSDEKTRRKAEWEVVRTLNKSFQGPIDAHINCHFSFRITRLLSGTSVLPNHVTFFAMFVGCLALLIEGLGGYLWTALGGVILEIHSILDSVDGELARLKFKGSKLGQWLDNVSDDIVDDLFVIACAIGTRENLWIVLAIIGMCARAFHQIYAYMVVYRSTRSADLYSFRWWFEKDKKTIDEVYDPKDYRTLVRALGRRDTYVFIWMIMCLFGLPEGVVVYGVVMGAIFGTMNLVHIVVTLYKSKKGYTGG